VAVEKAVGVGAGDSLGEEADALRDPFADRDGGGERLLSLTHPNLIPIRKLKTLSILRRKLEALGGFEEFERRIELGDGTRPEVAVRA
jgi:hypothetical protein